MRDHRELFHAFTYDDIAALSDLAPSTVYNKHRDRLSTLQDTILWLCENGRRPLRQKILDEAIGERSHPGAGVTKRKLTVKPRMAKKDIKPKGLPTAFEVDYEDVRALTAPRKDGKPVTVNSLHQARRRNYFRLENLESIVLWLAKGGTRELRQRMLKRVTADLVK